VVEYAYDPDHRLSKISYYDTEGELVNRKDTGAAYAYLAYDSLGLRKQMLYYDKTGQELR
jgi:YD repeat-containing protein